MFKQRNSYMRQLLQNLISKFEKKVTEAFVLGYESTFVMDSSVKINFFIMVSSETENFHTINPTENPNGFTRHNCFFIAIVYSGRIAFGYKI